MKGFTMCKLCRVLIQNNNPFWPGQWVSVTDGISCPTTTGEVTGHLPAWGN